MNKEKYKAVFSRVHPSAQAIERIMDMKNVKSKKRVVTRTIVAIAAVISLLMIGGIVANAATEGKVAESAKSAIESVASTRIKVIKNGKEAKKREYLTVEYEKDGFKNVKIFTKNGVCETKIPIDEYEERGLDIEVILENEQNEENTDAVTVMANGNGAEETTLVTAE